MIYTADQKKTMDSILTAFDSAIRGHDFFDILYCEKFGYVWLHIEPAEGCESVAVIKTADQLLRVLFNEIADEVRDSSGQEHMSLALMEGEEAETCYRVTEILKTMGPDASFAYPILDDFLKNYANCG